MLSNSSNVYYGSFKLLDTMESLIVATKDYDKENKKGNTSLLMKHFHECEIATINYNCQIFYLGIILSIKKIP